MPEFTGFVQLEQTYVDLLSIRDANGQPIAPDAAPTFFVYGPSGVLANAGGTVTDALTGTVTGATAGTPPTVTSVAHGLQTGHRVTLSGLGGMAGMTGVFTITKTGPDTYTLDGATGTGTYTTGGTWKLTGFYKASIVATGPNGFEAGEKYDVYYSYEVAAAARSIIQSLGVV